MPAPDRETARHQRRNQIRLTVQKRPLKPRDVWTIRVRLQLEGCKRDLAMPESFAVFVPEPFQKPAAHFSAAVCAHRAQMGDKRRPGRRGLWNAFAAPDRGPRRFTRRLEICAPCSFCWGTQSSRAPFTTSEWRWRTRSACRSRLSFKRSRIAAALRRSPCVRLSPPRPIES